jgi:organic radical activating enzyme
LLCNSSIYYTHGTLLCYSTGGEPIQHPAIEETCTEVQRILGSIMIPGRSTTCADL